MAQRVFPAADARPAPERILAIHALAYSIVGIFFIADALPGLVGVLVGIAAQWQRFNLRQYAPSTIEPAVKLALGIALFFGSHGLVRLWSRLRYAGIREKLGICIRCGYDLTGNTSGICPECGTPTRGQSPPAT